MADFYSAYMTCETGVLDYVDFPESEEPIWILGKKYSTIYGSDLQELRQNVKSKLWFTYRKNFPPIGGTGPSSDQGWGCMLRCGQMALAQALICRHLGKDWRWNPDSQDKDYLQLLKMFLDHKSQLYSIHQIAQMGDSEGKAVGEWFGPNTIAHVLKKLVTFDQWSSMVIHVAMDNTVIMEDIRQLCRGTQAQLTKDTGSELRNRDLSGSREQNNRNCVDSQWKPMLLFVPLRLGLSDINPVYVRGLKTMFLLPQSLGILGGRPNHALYFIGVMGNEVVFLDPHTTQLNVPSENDLFDDTSYHTNIVGRMDILQLDPSIALCFYFENEAEFENWCKKIYSLVIAHEKQPLFELCEERPPHWPPLETSPADDGGSLKADFTIVDRKFDTSDEEFELL